MSFFVGRCFRAVDFVADRHSKHIPVDKKPNHHVVYAFHFGKHPLDGFCQEALLLPGATFDDFFPLHSTWHIPRPTCGRSRIPVCLRAVSARWAPHQAPIRIKAADVSLPRQTSAPGTVGAPENRQCPALSNPRLLTNAMAPLWEQYPLPRVKIVHTTVGT
jgi:hypothetical protein